MESDTELHDDEEEVLVYVEFEGFVNNNIFTNGQLQLDMVGIDTDHPIMQIDGRFYEGTYEDVVGTYMFFEKDEKPFVDDPIFDQAPTLKYFGKTRKLLKMQRVFVKQRTEVLGDSEHSKCIPNMETIKQAGVPPKYQLEALSCWKDLRDSRINALCAYLEKQRIREEKRSQGIELDSESDEDNPFAVYKYKEEQKCEKNLENGNTNSDTLKVSTNEEPNQEFVEDNLDMLKYVHSKPSTSKSNETINFKQHKPTVKVIRKKTVHAAKNISSKKHKKKQKVIENETTQNSNDCNEDSSFLMLNKTLEDSAMSIETDNVMDTEQIISNITNVVENTTSDDKQISTDECEVKTSDNPMDKRHKKLLKREAKMREISEKLKTVAEEYLKANDNQ